MNTRTCARTNCGKPAAWRPIARYFAPAPYRGSFTVEIGLSLCPSCKAATQLRDFVTPEFDEVVCAAALRMRRMPPDVSRTVLEWIPSSETDFPDTEQNEKMRGPVAGNVFISDDPEEIASLRRCWGDDSPLEVVAPAALNLADLSEKWGSVANPPEYKCADCGGAFKHPIVGGDDVGVLVLRSSSEVLAAMTIHSRCLRARRVS